MSEEKRVREEKLWPASLNGHICRAFAWVQVTSLDVLDGQGRVQRVQGVRRWRGKALIDREALPAELSGNAVMRYAGKVKDGDEEREIEADVFLYLAQVSTAQPVTYDGGDGACSHETYVEFIGAGTPFK